MNARFLALGLIAASLVLSADAQPTTPAPAAPRRAPQAPVRSGEIAEDRRVTFRLRAPKASEVTVNGQWANGKAALAKGSNDVWSVTVGPVEPGKKHSMTMMELAFEADVEYSQIAKIERGVINTTVSTVQILAQALGVKPADLFQFSFPPKANK